MNVSKRLSQKTLFQSKYFQVDQMVLEKAGKTFTKDFIIRNPVVVILPLTAKNELYFVSQYRDALERTLLELPAGNIDPGEHQLAAAKRELAEETGLTATDWKEFPKLQLSANMQAEIHFFLARGLTEGKPDMDDDEEIETVKIPLAEAVKKVFNGEIEVATNIAAILLLEKLIQEGKI